MNDRSIDTAHEDPEMARGMNGFTEQFGRHVEALARLAVTEDAAELASVR